MLPTHRFVTTVNGCEIYQRLPGFEFTPILLAKIASYLVRSPDGTISAFAFLYSLLTEPLGQIDEDKLLDEAVVVIQQAIDVNAVPDADATFEYHDGRFVAVDQPRWWIPTRP